MLGSQDLLNLLGLAFQVGGVGSGVYSVREIIFPKKSPQSSFDSEESLFDNQPVDNKTKKRIGKLMVVNHRQAIGGITAIVLGLIIQMVAIFF